MDPQAPASPTFSPPSKRARRGTGPKVLRVPKVKSPRTVPNPNKVRAPHVLRAVPSVPASGRTRSHKKLIDRDLRIKKKKVRLFMEQATVINVPLTLEDLIKVGESTEQTLEETKAKLDKVCLEELGPNKPAQCMSARFVDTQGQTLLAYFGERIRKKEGTKHPIIDLKDQYTERTKDALDALRGSNQELIVHDGLTERQCRNYQLAAQALCSKSRVGRRSDFTRHEGGNIMNFDVEDDEANPEAYEKEDEATSSKEEVGVLHLVHGWTQRGHPSGGLYISSDISNTSTSLAATGSYYYLTQSVARTLAVMFKAVFPEHYKKYQAAFDAGVWLPNDPGPFLGRAVVYKLQGVIHKDKHDMGPSASFGVGQYSGGEMLIPQFGTKLAYTPGHVCLFFSSTIFHKVAKFTPAMQTIEGREEGVTPGRIGTVFFFPDRSFQVLQDRRPGWGVQTAFGMMEDLIPRREEEEEEEDIFESEEST